MFAKIMLFQTYPYICAPKSYLELQTDPDNIGALGTPLGLGDPILPTLMEPGKPTIHIHPQKHASNYGTILSFPCREYKIGPITRLRFVIILQALVSE